MTKEELALHKGLLKILDEGTFSLKAREMPAFLKIYDWVKSMPDKKPSKKKAKK